MRNILTILLFLSLGGCAFTPYNTQFECPLEKGVPCTRLSTINKIIDRGDLGEEAPSGPMCKGDCFKKEVSKDPRITYFQKKKEIPATSIEEPKEEGRGQEGYILFEEEGEF